MERLNFKGPLLFSQGKINSCGVAVDYFGIKDFTVVSKVCDRKGRILILDVVLNNTNFLLISFSKSNLEPDKICTLSTLLKLLEREKRFNNKNIILGGYSNLFFDSKYHT